jgi:quinol monooxygenase YgiN
MATIQKGRELVTLINVFKVDPKDQQQLVDLLVDATEQTMKHLPGFVSASIHRSLDGKTVVNYAQWSSKEAFEAIKQNPEAAAHMKAAAELATFDPILCDVADSLSA